MDQHHLFVNFAVSSAMLVLCVVIHGFGLFSLNKAMRSEANEERMRRMTALSFRGAVFTLFIVLSLLFAVVLALSPLARHAAHQPETVDAAPATAG